MSYFKEEHKNHNSDDNCPMCSIDEATIKKLKKEAEKKQKNKKEENK
ncbi:MAG: hypothetical protein AB1465_02915 [Patescibacteria group bacterium]